MCQDETVKLNQDKMNAIGRKVTGVNKLKSQCKGHSQIIWYLISQRSVAREKC